jgi:hypothetical protein
VKILTLTQPWATLVALGAKQIETRSWSTPYRGSIAIHAAAGLKPVGGPMGLQALCSDQHFRSAIEPAIYEVRVSKTGEAYPVWDLAKLPRGAIVAVANLVRIVESLVFDRVGDISWTGPDGTPYHYTLTDQERAFGDYSSGRYAWLLADVRPLRTPLPYRGAQGLRPLPAEVVAQIYALDALSEV